MKIIAFHQIFMRLFLCGAFTLTAPGAQADSSRDVERIVTNVVFQGIEKTHTAHLPGTQLKMKTFRLNHPDKVINPQKLESTYSGLPLADFIAFAAGTSHGLERQSDSRVTFVGRDAYTVSVPLKDALDAQAIITLKESDSVLNWKKGAPFLAFLSLKNSQYLAEPSWWGWWVSAILVGEPFPSLALPGRKLDERALATHCSTKEKGVLNYPRGRRKAEPARNMNGELVGCTVSDLLDRVGKKPDAKKKHVAEFLTGQTLILDDASAFRVVRTFNGANISAELGGPLQPCETAGKKECRYFLTGLLESL